MSWGCPCTTCGSSACLPALTNSARTTRRALLRSSPRAGAGQCAFHGYLNAPGAGGDLTRPPRLRVSFGGRSYAVVMDTGSTGIVVSADKIPNIDGLQTQGPGRLTYSSSGSIMIGRWVVTPVTIMGRNGTSIAVAPISVLAVDRVECTDSARRCSPRA